MSDAGDAGISPDAGHFDAGYTADGGPFTWSVMPLDLTYRHVRSVSGLAANDVYALTSVSSSSFGKLLHYDGNSQGTWVPLLDITGGDLVAVKALPARGAVAVISNSAFYYCAGGCNDAGAYQIDYAPMTQFRFACANATDAFALGDEMGTLAPVLWRSDPAGWRLHARFSTLRNIYGCAVAADGTVLVSGHGEVGVAFLDGGTRVDSVSTDNWPDSIDAWFGSMAPVGTDIFMVSGWSVVQRSPDRTASRVFLGDDLQGSANAIGYAHPDEVFIIGVAQDASTIVRRYLGTWSVVSPWENNVDWKDLWFASQNDIFAVGQKKNYLGGIEGGRILHGKR